MERAPPSALALALSGVHTARLRLRIAILLLVMLSDSRAQIRGCGDPRATNYDATVEEDDGSCEFAGCSINLPAHGESGTCDPGGALAHGASCELTCASGYSVTPDSAQPSCSMGELTSDVECQQSGCMELHASNYDADAVLDDGSCTYPEGAHCEAGSIPQPDAGSFGTCLTDGSLRHGQSCELACAAGYAPVQPAAQPTCWMGEVTSAFACARSGCTDRWSENLNRDAVVNRDCIFACGTLSARLKVAGLIPALSNPVCLVLEEDRASVDHPEEFTVETGMVKIVQGTPAMND